MKQPGKIAIFDTTMRDGEQAPGCHLSPEQKLTFAKQLHRLNVDVIEAGFPISSNAEFEAVRAVARTVGTSDSSPEICAFTRCVDGDIDRAWEAVRDARRPRLHLFIATSEIHMRHKLHLSRDQVIERAVSAVRHAARYTSNIQFAAEDAFRSDRKFLFQFFTALIEAGVTTINIPDTVGYAIPAEFAGLIRAVKKNVPNIERAVISVHCHDDLGMAVANSLSAIHAGARQIECTVNGIGERAGNASLEEVAMAIRTRAAYFGSQTQIETQEIYSTTQMLSEMIHMPIPANKAIVGENAFAHASGIHQDGMLKNRQTYEIMRPEDIGVPPSRLVLTSRSGRNALADRLKKLGIEMETPVFLEAYRRFKAVADSQISVSDADLFRIHETLKSG